MERKGNNIAEDTFLYWMDVERYMAEFKEGNFNNYEECQTVLRYLALREMNLVIEKNNNSRVLHAVDTSQLLFLLALTLYQIR